MASESQRNIFAAAVLMLASFGFTAPAVAVETMTGELVREVADDFENELWEEVYGLVEDPTGVYTRLSFATAPGLEHGSLISVTGEFDGTDFVVSEASLLAPPGAAAAKLPPTGQFRTAVLMADFTDTTPNCSVSETHSVMFGSSNSVDGVIDESSYGETGFFGDVLGPYTIPHSSDEPCNYWTWNAAVRDAAADAGVDLGLYDEIVYVIPNPNQCNLANGWGGIAPIGGNYMTIFTCKGRTVFAHELGHNLGMGHAGLSSTRPYGDLSGLMGGAWVGSWIPLRHFNAPHKIQMGWVAPEDVMTAQGCGTYRTSALAEDPANGAYPPVIFVDVPGTSRDVYVSYRAPVGYDANLRDAYKDMLQVHSWTSGSALTYLLANLDEGDTYDDSIAGVHIGELSRGPQAMTFDLTLGNTPDVVLDPVDAIGGSLETLVFDLTLTSTDAGGDPRSYDLSGFVDSSFSVSGLPGELILAAGQTAVVPVSITAPETLPDGSYPLGFFVNSDCDEFDVSVTGNYIFDELPPSTPQGLSATGGNMTVQLQWNPSSDAGSGVALYRIFRNGSPVGTSSTTHYTDGQIQPRATYSYQVQAVDHKGQASGLSAPRRFKTGNFTPPDINMP